MSLTQQLTWLLDTTPSEKDYIRIRAEKRYF